MINQIRVNFLSIQANIFLWYTLLAVSVAYLKIKFYNKIMVKNATKVTEKMKHLETIDPKFNVQTDWFISSGAKVNTFFFLIFILVIIYLMLA